MSGMKLPPIPLQDGSGGLESMLKNMLKNLPDPAIIDLGTQVISEWKRRHPDSEFPFPEEIVSTAEEVKD